MSARCQRRAACERDVSFHFRKTRRGHRRTYTGVNASAPVVRTRAMFWVLEPATRSQWAFLASECANVLLQ